MDILAYVLEGIGAVICVTFVIVKGVKAQKRGEGAKAFFWFFSVPAVAVAGVFLATIVMIAGFALAVFGIIALVGGSLSGSGGTPSPEEEEEEIAIALEAGGAISEFSTTLP